MILKSKDKNNKIGYIAIFLLGCLCFFVSQILIRIPIWNRITRTIDYSIFSLNHPVLVFVIVSFSAGLFEEGFRFLFR